jgi:hypothetical protein
MIVAPLSARIVDWAGSKVVVAAGMTLTTVGLLLMSGMEASSSFASFGWRMVVTACGLALTMAPATDSIMGSLPLAKAGVGSAVNDTTRQVGGALGVAVIGSVFASIYDSHLTTALSGRGLSESALAQARDSIGGALQVATGIGGPDARVITDAARQAFVDGMHAGFYIGAAITAIGLVVTLVWLPARERDDERARAEHALAGTADGAAGGAATGRSAAQPAP